MAGIDLGLSNGMRNTLLALQTLQAKIGTSQERLASGNRVNTMVDAPPIFFAARNLNNRANDLMSLKDAMGQAISTVKAGSKGADTIQNLLAQARGLTTAAMGAMGTDAGSIATRKNLAERFDDILTAINGVVDDSAYGGKNLIKGTGAGIDSTIESKSKVIDIRGIDNVRITDAKREDNYRIEVIGTGAISGNKADVADAEQSRGIRPIHITGIQSDTQGNFNPITINVKGEPGRGKSFIVGNEPESITVSYTQEQWKASKANNQPLTLDHTFSSGVRVQFCVDFDEIDETLPNHGQGLSSIEKRVDLGVRIKDGSDYTVTRDLKEPLGSGRLADGENAFVFPNGTVRLVIDEKTLTPSPMVGSSSPLPPSVSPVDYVFCLDISGSMSPYLNAMRSNVEQFINTRVAAGADIRYAFTTYSDSVTQAEPIISSPFYTDPTAFKIALDGISLLNGGDAAESGLEALQQIRTMPFRPGVGRQVAVITDYTVHVAGDGSGTTNTVAGTLADLQNDGIVVSVAGFPGDAAWEAISLGTGGTFSNVFDPSFFTSGFGLPPLPPAPPPLAPLSTQSAELQVKDSSPPMHSDDLFIAFNSTQTDGITVASENLQVSGLGLQVDYSQNEWRDLADVENASKGLDKAEQRLRSASQALTNGLNIVTTRETFTKEFSDVLVEGANKLTLLDQNEEGSSLLMLQTRQQLSTTALSLAAKSQQTILNLF